MEKYKLKELFIEHKEKFFSKEGLIQRDIQEKIRPYLHSKETVLITGVRRSGKSSLLKLVADDLISRRDILKTNTLYLNFEDERFVDFTVKDFDSLVEVFLELENPKGRKCFFLDEIQNIKGWEKWVHRMGEFENIKFYITGSNAALLSSEVSHALTGRNRQVVNWPFSFREFLLFHGLVIDGKEFYVKEKRARIKNLLGEYIKGGGFPEVVKSKDNTLLEQYFRDILYRDLIVRYSIKNTKELKELCLFLASNIAAIYSYDRLKKMIGAKNLNTIKNYLESLENVFLFFRVALFDYSVKRQIYNPGKFYMVDTALAQAIGFKFSEDAGHVYENLVFLELKRRGRDLYYWKSKKGQEVDFVLRKGLKVEEAIQVCFNLGNPETREREFRSLLAAKEELNPSRYLIITQDEEGEEKINQCHIQIIPLWKWLLLG